MAKENPAQRISRLFLSYKPGSLDPEIDAAISNVRNLISTAQTTVGLPEFGSVSSQIDSILTKLNTRKNNSSRNISDLIQGAIEVYSNLVGDNAVAAWKGKGRMPSNFRTKAAYGVKDKFDEILSKDKAAHRSSRESLSESMDAQTPEAPAPSPETSQSRTYSSLSNTQPVENSATSTASQQQSQTSSQSAGGYYRVGNEVYDSGGNYISFDEAQRRGIVDQLASIPQKAGSGVEGYYRIGNEVHDASGNYISFDEANRRGIVPLLESIPDRAGGSLGAATAPDTSGGVPSTGDPYLDGLLGQMDKWLKDQEALGKKLNPNIELSPQIVQKFLDQATEEIAPYYKQQYGLIKDDLSKNLQSLQESYENQRKQEEVAFRNSLEQTRQGYADSGLAFSGVRGRGERDITTNENLKLAGLGNQYASQAGGIARSAESQVGSRNLAGLNTPVFNQYKVNTSGPGYATMSQDRNLDFWSPGSVTGSLEREQLTSIKSRQNELENAERSKRALDFYAA